MNELTHYGSGNPLGGDEPSGGAVQVHQHVDAEVAKIAALLRIPVVRERDLEAVERRIKQIAALEGDGLFYEYPVKEKGGGTKKIIGPTVKLAYALVTAYGNCGTTCEVVDTEDAWIFNATFIDRETGSVNSRLFRQRKGQESLKTDKERQLDIAFQIGQSKAIRNVVVNSLRFMAERGVELAKEAIIHRIKKAPEAYREKALKRLAEYGVKVETVSASIGSGPNNWTPDDIASVVYSLQAITEGVAKVDDIWPTPKVEAPPAPPPPGAEKKPDKKPDKPKAKAPEKPADGEALIEQFTNAPDIATLDTLWEQNEKLITAADADLQARLTKAYDERRQALEAQP